MAWAYLFIAGLLETVWAVGLKYADGFTEPVPSVITAAALIGSMIFLALALRAIPVVAGIVGLKLVTPT